MIDFDDFLWALLDITSFWPFSGGRERAPLWARILGALIIIAILTGLVLVVGDALGWF